MDSMRCLTKPFFDWTEEEKKRLPELIEVFVSSGVQIIVLGQKRCFFCGTEINSEPDGDCSKVTQKHGSGKGLIVTNLCDKCFKLVPDDR